MVIEAKKWYVIEIIISEEINPGIYSDPIVMKTTSKFSFTGFTDSPDSNMIIYD
jgi:hypothetical protein